MKIKATFLTDQDLERIKQINIERLRQLKAKGYTKEQLMYKFSIVFVQKYFDQV